MLVMLMGFCTACSKKGDVVQDNKSSDDENIEILTSTYPTTFYVLGAHVDFDDRIVSKDISLTDVDKIHVDGKEWAMIVVNDIDNDISYDKSDWEMIVEKVQSNLNINCMYIGNTEYQAMYNAGYYTDKLSNESNVMSLGMVHEGTEIVNSFGMYTGEDDVKDLASRLMSEEVYCLKQR